MLQVLGAVVGPAVHVFDRVGQLRLDHQRVAVQALGQHGAGSSPEAVPGLDLGGVAHADQGGTHRVFRDGAFVVALASKHHGPVAGVGVQLLQDGHGLAGQGHQVRVAVLFAVFLAFHAGGRNGPQAGLQVDL